MDRLPGLFGREVPKRTIDPVTGRTRSHGLLEAVAIEPARNLGAHRHYGVGYALERLAISGVGDALAAAAMFAFGKLGDDHRRFGFAAAADRERTGNRPALDTDGKGGHQT